jgi:hypothetical protein
MFTVLWKTPNGGEEIFVAPSVSRIPGIVPGTEDADRYDCHGRPHIAMQCLTDQDSQRIVIDMGEVFVMNAEGRTVATYRF